LQTLCAESLTTTPDYITYPPISFKDRLLRGPNHAKILAQELGKILGVPLICPYTKTIFSRHQAKQPREKRYQVQRFYTLRKDAQDLTGQKILLVDDLITTGYTAHTLAHLLKNLGATSVEGYFLASEKI
jgi:predicted amidophosphoribosyltransferase